MKADPEQALRQMRWRDPPPQFLQHVLSTALEASRQRPGVLQPSGAFREPEDVRKRRRTGAPHRPSRLWAFLSVIPRPLRLPLAACWLLALFFRITTPESIPQSTLNNYAKLPPITPAQLLANLKQVERLAHELVHPQHHGDTPPL